MKDIIDEYGDFLLAASVVLIIMGVLTLTLHSLGKSEIIESFFKSILGQKALIMSIGFPGGFS